MQFWKIKNVNRVLEAELVLSTRSETYIDIIVSSSFEVENGLILSDDIRVCLNPAYLKGFQCQEPDCQYKTKRKSNMQRHTNRHGTERIKYRRRRFGRQRPVREFLRDILPRGYQTTNVIVFDIESVMKPHTDAVVIHVPVMIAMQNNFLSSDKERVICRFDMTGEGLKTLVNEFLDVIISWLKLHLESTPMCVQEFLTRARDKVSSGKLSPAHKAWFSKRIRAIEGLLELKILGYNSMRYDLIALANAIIDLSMERFGNDCVTVIKKGQGYFNMKIETPDGVIVFRDVRSYTTAQSLDNFANSWHVEQSKLCWPYALYGNLTDVQNETLFPHYSSFKSSLTVKKDEGKLLEELKVVLEDENKIRDQSETNRRPCSFGEMLNIFGIDVDLDSAVLNGVIFPDDIQVQNIIAEQLHLSPLKFIDSWKLYNFEFVNGKWTNLLDYFKYYNKIDVSILMQAWENYTKLFFDTFKVHLLDSWSLPGVAQDILISRYPDGEAPVMTFCSDYGFLNVEVRRNLVGGFAGPIQLRHVELGAVDDQYDQSVYFSSSGQKFRNIIQYDANSLYPSTMLKKQPTGVGVYLRPKDESSNFTAELMLPKETFPKYSKISLEFLDMMQGKLNTRGEQPA